MASEESWCIFASCVLLMSFLGGNALLLNMIYIQRIMYESYKKYEGIFYKNISVVNQSFN